MEPELHSANGMNRRRQTLREYLAGAPRGSAAPEAESALLMPPLPRVTKKGALPLVRRVGGTRSAPVRSQNWETGGMDSPN